MKKLSFIGLLFLPWCVKAQSPFKGFENLFVTPKSYVVNYVKTPPVIDGDINDAVWQQAQWSDNFKDIEGDLKPDPPLQTNVKMLWGDSCIYIAAKIMDPNVWATLKKHDEVVFHDNDFEVFIDINNTTQPYFELEFNPLNTVFDLFLNKPYRNGGNAIIGWNAEGLKSAVKVQGTLNNPGDVDKGWTVEIAIPYHAISIGNDAQVPVDGTIWRINFSRVEWDAKVVNSKYVKITGSDNIRSLPEHNWVWSPAGIVSMHSPERWGYLQFNKNKTNTPAFTLPYAEQQKQYLWLIYYQQKKWFTAHKSYNPSLEVFSLTNNVAINSHANNLQLEATAHQFIAFITDKNEHITWTINQDGLISQINN